MAPWKRPHDVAAATVVSALLKRCGRSVHALWTSCWSDFFSCACLNPAIRFSRPSTPSTFLPLDDDPW